MVPFCVGARTGRCQLLRWSALETCDGPLDLYADILIQASKSSGLINVGGRLAVSTIAARLAGPVLCSTDTVQSQAPPDR
jgi:hypothetical protein